MCDHLEEDKKLLTRLSLLTTCGQTFIPDLPGLGSITSPSTSLSLLKTRFSSSLRGSPRNSLAYCGASVLYQITSLLLDDHALTGHYGNGLAYLDITLASLQCLSTTDSLYLCVEYLSKARNSLKQRIRNLNNKQLDTDRIKRLNFLNRVEQLDQAMVALREVLLISIMRQHSRARGMQLDSYKGGDGLDTSSSSCDPDSPVLGRKVLNNNTITMGTSMKTSEKTDELTTLMGGMEVSVVAVPSVLTEVAVTSSLSSSPPIPEISQSNLLKQNMGNQP